MSLAFNECCSLCQYSAVTALGCQVSYPSLILW